MATDRTSWQWGAYGGDKKCVQSFLVDTPEDTNRKMGNTEKGRENVYLSGAGQRQVASSSE
jgi:hypothetical protein